MSSIQRKFSWAARQLSHALVITPNRLQPILLYRLGQRHDVPVIHIFVISRNHLIQRKIREMQNIDEKPYPVRFC